MALCLARGFTSRWCSIFVLWALRGTRICWCLYFKYLKPLHSNLSFFNVWYYYALSIFKLAFHSKPFSSFRSYTKNCGIIITWTHTTWFQLNPANPQPNMIGSVPTFQQWLTCFWFCSLGGEIGYSMRRYT